VTNLRHSLQPFNRDYRIALLTGYGLTAFTIIIQLVLVPLYLAHLGKERFGILVMILAANNYAAIGITWLSGSMARILAERAAVGDRVGFAEAYAYSKLVYVAYALIALAGFWVLAPWLLSDALADPEIRAAILVSSIFFLLSYEYNTDRQALNARHLQARGNLNEFAGQLVFAASVGIGLVMDMGLPGVVAGQVAGVLCTRILVWLQWRRDDYALRWKRRIHGIRALSQRVGGRVGRDYIVYGIMLLTLQADALIVGWLAGPGVAADYYLLWRIPEVCILLLLRIPSAYAPHIIAMDARREHEALWDGYKRGLFFMLGLASAAALVYGIAGNWIVRLWVGHDAPAGFWPYAIAAVAMFFTAVSRWPSEFAFAMMNTKRLVRVAALETVAKLVLLGLFYGTLGYIAPLVAICLAHALGVFYLYLWLGKSNFTHLGQQ
jgi:O-antigen/teichoic acid export membrane protein